jgi:hypothetical protein
MHQSMESWNRKGQLVKLVNLRLDQLALKYSSTVRERSVKLVRDLAGNLRSNRVDIVEAFSAADERQLREARDHFVAKSP